MGNLVLMGTARKSQKQESIDPRSRHISEWCESSDSFRNKCLGETFAENAEKLYNLQDAMTPGPVYRPSLSIPMLQRIMLEEANQVSNLSPRMYIFPSAGAGDPSYSGAQQADSSLPSSSARDLAREVSLQAQWQISKMNLHLLIAAPGGSLLDLTRISLVPVAACGRAVSTRASSSLTQGPTTLGTQPTRAGARG